MGLHQLRRGARGGHRCHELPVDPEMRRKKKKRFKKAKFVLTDPVRDEDIVSQSRTKDMPDVNEKTTVQYEMLCAGQQFRVSRRRYVFFKKNKEQPRYG